MNFETPFIRPRRLRKNNAMRSLMQETRIQASDLVYPIFITDGVNVTTPIESMAGINRLSIELAVKQVKQLFDKGIKGFALFPNTPNFFKNATAVESFNKNNLMNNAIRSIKASVPECIIFADVALDPYTSHGHDGLIDDNGYVLNDETVKILMTQAVVQAQAGADVICPSDMMDGRIVNIRNALDENGFGNVSIMSYSAKYSSNFYGPFRDAVGSSGALKGDKKTYQMNPANWQEALKEAQLDIDEGADMLMVKPGMAYLDILQRIKSEFEMPTCVYQVSGEYSMIQNMIDADLMNEDAILESMIAFKRAGADLIFTYFTPRIIDLID